MTPRDLLRLRDVRLLLAGQGLSWVGDAFNPIALSVAVWRAAVGTTRGRSETKAG